LSYKLFGTKNYWDIVFENKTDARGASYKLFGTKNYWDQPLESFSSRDSRLISFLVLKTIGTCPSTVPEKKNPESR